jgi:uncharacterized membrane protein YhaH (DUF805 family)
LKDWRQNQMKGRITEYRQAESKGTIAAFNAERYGFGRGDWRSPGEPARGLDVEFLIDGRSAREIALRTPDPARVLDDMGLPADMGFLDAVNICFDKFATFEGRARRKEFWYFTLFVFLANFAALIVQAIVLGTAAASGLLTTLLSLALSLPWLAVFARRLHDTDRSAWWAVVLYIVPRGYFLLSDLPARFGITGVLGLLGWRVLVPFSIMMLLALLAIPVLAALRGTAGTNQYGADPLAGPEDVF